MGELLGAASYCDRIPGKDTHGYVPSNSPKRQKKKRGEMLQSEYPETRRSLLIEWNSRKSKN